MAGRFFVYELIDPRDDVVFYVGKGQGDRHRAHEVEARAGRQSRKCEKIREIWASDREVSRNIISRHEIEDDAYAAEKARIEEIGLENLTNIIPGGRIYGPYPKTPFRWTEKIAVQIIPRLQRAVQQMRDGDGRLYALNDIDITEYVYTLVHRMIRDLGATLFTELMSRDYRSLKAKGQ